MLIKRLKEYIDYKGLSIYAFEQSLGLANNTIRKKLVSSRNNMGTDTLQLILEKYSELSSDWLLLGIGNMLRADNKENKGKEDSEKESAQLDIIRQQQQTISELTKAITTLIENSSKS